MAWIYVLVAAAFEVAWAVGLKYSGGLTRPGPAGALRLGCILLILLGVAGLRLTSG
jgi:quaternary ammonium compound-resistance protein SugE